MDLDPGIICYFHCSSRIFSFVVQEHCPSCGDRLSDDILPFRVPYPFVRPSQHSCSIVIKSTDGTFLRDYKDQDDLHIGVTSSKGVLFEYDHRGLTVGPAPPSWNESLVVYRETIQDRFSLWDNRLNAVAEQPIWTSARYSEVDFNCYDFVLAFLQTKNNTQGDLASTRSNFIEQYVSPAIFQALKYIKLHRHVTKYGYLVSSSN